MDVNSNGKGSPDEPMPAASMGQGAGPDGQAKQEGEAAPPVLSKNQQKKLLKQQNVEAHRLAKKAEKKALQQQKQAVKKASIDQMLATMPEQQLKDWKEQQETRRQERMAAKHEQKAMLQKAVESGQKLVIDLDFDGMMSDKELKSLMQQLSYSYSASMRGEVPCHLHLLGASGTVKEKMEKQLSGMGNWVATVSEQRWQEYFKDQSSDLVYLSADAEHELETLNPNHIYIIGGLVDRNRYKSECFNRAKQAGIATARLPIGQYVKLATSQVITINQVVDILVGYQASGDWRKVLESVLPVRKVAAGEENDAAGMDADDNVPAQAGADNAAEQPGATDNAAAQAGAADNAAEQPGAADGAAGQAGVADSAAGAAGTAAGQLDGAAGPGVDEAQADGAAGATGGDGGAVSGADAADGAAGGAEAAEGSGRAAAAAPRAGDTHGAGVAGGSGNGSGAGEGVDGADAASVKRKAAEEVLVGGEGSDVMDVDIGQTGKRPRPDGGSGGGGGGGGGGTAA